MNAFLAVALGGAMLFLVGCSLVAIYKIGQAEMGAYDRRVALGTVAAILVASAALVFIFYFARQ